MSKNRNQQRTQDLSDLVRLKTLSADQESQALQTQASSGVQVSWQEIEEPSGEALTIEQAPSTPVVSEAPVEGFNEPAAARGLTPTVLHVEEAGLYEKPQDKEAQWGEFQKLVATEVQPAAPSAVVQSASAPAAVAPFPNLTPKEVKTMRNIESQLNNYAAAMDPKQPTTQEDQGRWSYTLFQLIRSTLVSTPEESFRAEWAAILGYFQKNAENIFNENFLFRAPHHWTGSDAEFATFRRIAYVLIETANPQTRQKALARLNLERATVGLPEAGRNRLLSFYG